jgi:hypothetical protein
MRRLPPSKIEQNLNGILNLVPSETDEILQRVDQPLKELADTKVGRKFLLCDYNRDGDSYRYAHHYHFIFCFIHLLNQLYVGEQWYHDLRPSGHHGPIPTFLLSTMVFFPLKSCEP